MLSVYIISCDKQVNWNEGKYDPLLQLLLKGTEFNAVIITVF